MGATFTDEQLSLDTVTAINTTTAKTSLGGKTAQKMLVTVTGSDARVRVGADPTVVIGLLLKITTDKPYEFSGYDFIKDARFIATDSGTATVDVQYVLL
ncbi:MAG: hypothetical protein GY821_12600 [Gammaproteobacteria bacterium]|nr:hypothetical protein [Gammaproteobacteria bacterium]